MGDTGPGKSTPASQVEARWEWRIFATDLSEAGKRLAALCPDPSPPVAVSDELYILSTLCDANVKIRDRLIDIKRLERTGSDGLEQWCPVLKAGFPLTPDTVAEIFGALNLPAPGAGRPRYTLDELLEELIEPDPRLSVVPVHKTRTRYALSNAAAELTRIAVGDRTVWTMAVESVDPAAVMAAVRQIGPPASPPASYPRALKGLIGLAPDPTDAG